MSSAPPLNIRAVDVAPFINLTTLQAELLASPEGLYMFSNYVSTRYGPKLPGKGGVVRVVRVLPLASPDPDNLAAYDAGVTRNSTPILVGSDLQRTDFSSVDITVSRRRMPKPVAEKTESLQLSQIDLELAHRVNLKRNFNEFKDDLIRETYRSSVGNEIFGNSLRATADDMTSVPATDGLSTAVIREFRRRAAALHLRPMGSAPGPNMQALDGFFVMLTDQHGVNELLGDIQWREFARYNPDRENYVKGYIGEYEQVMVLKSDRMRTTAGAGPSGDTFNAHEAYFLAGDPLLIEPGDGESQGFMSEFPVVFAQVGIPEVKRASEDDFQEDNIFTWFLTCGTAATEVMSDDTADALTEDIGGVAGGDTPDGNGMMIPGGSRFITRALFA